MASPTQITEGLPETLPEDFAQWDQASPSAQPVQSRDNEPRRRFWEFSKPANETAEAQCAATPSGNLAHGAAQGISAPESKGGATAPGRAQSLSPDFVSSRDNVVPLHAAAPAVNELRWSGLRPYSATAAATMTEFYQTLLPSVRANAVELTRATKEKWAITASASAALMVVLAAAAIFVFNRDTMPAAEPAATPAHTMSTTQQPEHAAPTQARSNLAMPESNAAASTGTEAQINSEASRRPVQKNAEPSREQAQIMDHQLHAPTRLQMKPTLPEPASLPPSALAAADIHGLENGSAIGAVFASPKQPKVQVASQQVSSPKDLKGETPAQPVVSVPSAVALGLLIEKTQPIYPLIAKSARVSGTVVLAATISETGKVENLSAVSGPEMLRYPAVDAVRTWRFKPYMLNNQPTAIRTTINLHFSLN